MEIGLESLFTVTELVSSFVECSFVSALVRVRLFSSFAFAKYASIRCALRKSPKLSTDEGEAR
jgi:hypothetical protein